VGKVELQSWSWWRLSEACARCSRKWNLVRRRNDVHDKVEDTDGTDIECLIIRVHEKCFMLFIKYEYCLHFYGVMCGN